MSENVKKITKEEVERLAEKALSHCQNIAVGIQDGELYYYNYTGNMVHGDNVFYCSSTQGMSPQRLVLEILSSL